MNESERRTEQVITNAEHALMELTAVTKKLQAHTERVDSLLSRYTFTVLVSAAEGLFTPAEFEAVGGITAVRKAVRVLYDKVMNDPSLAHFFEGVDMVYLRQKQVKMFLALFGAKDYEVMDLRLAHANHDISHEDFDKMMRHLAASLAEVGLGPDDVLSVVGKVRVYEREVVNDA